MTPTPRAVANVPVWEELANEAEEFAASVRREKLINISLAASGAAWKGLIVVWYWE